MADHYSILGINPGASKDEIRKAFRRLAMEWHPDRNSSPDAEDKFVAIQMAYDALMEGRTSRRFSFRTARTKTPTEKRKEEQHERIKQYILRRQTEFKSEREEYRRSKLFRAWFYSEAWFDLVIAFLILFIPVAASIYNNTWWYLVLMPLSIGMGASFYFKGERLLKRANMIYGSRDVFSMQELEDVYFYTEPGNDPYGPSRRRGRRFGW
ncbi:MAG TPA: J domain-containing protein [Bacteroidia bacterium]|jgi:curved DNA-binding protein CbpA|nr:J domain-containing protein [Bacteroidia bacterium]